MLSLFCAYFVTGELKIRNILIEQNLGLARLAAHEIAKKCSEPWGDLYAEGCLGLIKAVERFNPYKKNRFSSFAMPYIRGKIQQYLRDKGRLVRLPEKIQLLEKKSKQAIVILQTELRRSPTEEEICDYLKINPAYYRKACFAIAAYKNLASLDEISADTCSSDRY